jgi:GAF domain-containing protein
VAEEVRVEPIAATVRALERLSRYGDKSDARALEEMAAAAQRLVPTCTGISLTVLDGGMSITLVASSDECALLDAMQYLDGGPCVECVATGEVVDVDEEDALEEGRWSMFSRASAAVGVASSLSMPILRSGEVVGGTNLYASTPGAFTGYHESLAEALGAWAPGAVTDADLSFDRRREAAETLSRIIDQGDINLAIGMVAEGQSVTTGLAHQRIREAAARSGLTEAEVARVVIAVRRLDL